LVYTHTQKKKCPFAVGVFRNFKIPAPLIRQIAVKGAPILANELFWSLSVTICNQCYSTRGLDVVAAMNISFTLQNLLSVAYFALSSSIAIIVGNLLGAGKLDEAKSEDRKLLAFAMLVGCMMMGVQFAVSDIFPLLYETSAEVRELSGYILRCFALTMPAAALATSTYYTIRSGGRVFITMLFDSVYAWVIVMPVVFIIAYLTNIPFALFLPIVLVIENLKLVPGLILVHKGIWVRQLNVN
jgi:Na+-driven multidrug efflux pump